MKRTSIKPTSGQTLGLASLILFGLLPTVIAQTNSTSTTPAQNNANVQYAGGNYRVGIGIDKDRNVRGEVSGVLFENDNSAALGEAWANRERAGGLKLSYHWADGSISKTAVVNKVFIAADQNTDQARKLSLGYGQDRAQWSWAAYLSRGISSEKLMTSSTTANTVTQTGADAGRPFTQDLTTTVLTQLYAKPYDWGVGFRAGHFFEKELVRMTAGLDYEWGKYASSQSTVSLALEKYFSNSPHSVMLLAGFSSRRGDYDANHHHTFGYLTYRYDFGGNAWRPSKTTRNFTVTEMREEMREVTVPAPAPQPIAPPPAAVVAPPPEPTYRTEKRVVSNSKSNSAETFFTIGKASLDKKAMSSLDPIAAGLANLPANCRVEVKIAGNTCPTGVDRNNTPLSQKRADAVKDYLLKAAGNLPNAQVSTAANAGNAPKYPEVKGQAWRNRRADTEAVIICDTTEEVKVLVPAPVVAQASTPTPVAVPPAEPTKRMEKVMVPIQVTKTETVDAPSVWAARALHNPIQHLASVGTYGRTQTTTTQAFGSKTYINRCPVVTNDALNVAFNTAGTVDVLANDKDADGDTLLLSSVGTPANGTAVISGGKVTYTPKAGFSGTDSFTYTMSDGKCAAQTGTVSVTVDKAPVPVNRCPVLTGDTLSVAYNTAGTVDVLANDKDPDGDKLSISAVGMPSNGTAVLAGGKITYTPRAGFSGTDSFSYTVTDGQCSTQTANVSVTVDKEVVVPPPPPPVEPIVPLICTDDILYIPCAGGEIDVLANDTLTPGSKIVSVTQPPIGSADILPSGKIRINAGDRCYHTQTFTYTVANAKNTATCTGKVILIDP